jgi:SET domain
MRIIQYIGEKISSRERARRLAAGNAYIFHLTYRYAIDGQTLENTARYINHSCDPNCAVEKTSDTIWSRVGTVDLFRCGVSPSPNRACTFQRTRLSILSSVPEAYFSTVSIRMTSFSAWNLRTVSLSLSCSLSSVLPLLIRWLIQCILAAKPITGKRRVLWRLRYHTGVRTQANHQLRQSCLSA